MYCSQKPQSEDRSQTGRATTRRWIPALALLGSSLAGIAGAAEINLVEVERSGQMYRLHSDITLRAPLERVRVVLSRYERIPRLDPDIREVTILGPNANGGVRMRLVSSQCLGVICKRVRWTQDVRTLPSGDILAEMVPSDGDIQAGWVRYRTVHDDHQTRLIVDAEIDASSIPLPGVLLDPLMQRRLENEALETARLVELAASRPNTRSMTTLPPAGST